MLQTNGTFLGSQVFHHTGIWVSESHIGGLSVPELVLVNASSDPVLDSQFVQSFVVLVIATTHCIVMSHPFSCHYQS